FSRDWSSDVCSSDLCKYSSWRSFMLSQEKNNGRINEILKIYLIVFFISCYILVLDFSPEGHLHHLCILGPAPGVEHIPTYILYRWNTPRKVPFFHIVMSIISIIIR